jgi:hypothetical protein
MIHLHDEVAITISFLKFVSYMMINPHEDLAKFGYKWDMKKIN